MKIITLGLASLLAASALLAAPAAEACSFKVSSGMLKGDSFVRLHKSQHPVAVAVYADPSAPLSPQMKNLAEMLKKVGHKVRIVNNVQALSDGKSQVVLSANFEDADKVKQVLKASNSRALVVPVVNSAPGAGKSYAGTIASNGNVAMQVDAFERVATHISTSSGASATAVLAAP